MRLLFHFTYQSSVGQNRIVKGNTNTDQESNVVNSLTKAYLTATLPAVLTDARGLTASVLAAVVMIVLSTFPGAASAATVTLSPGANIQSSVNSHPPGTTFVLKPGTYRGQSVTSLKNGDSFIGQKGADLNGAKVLTGWKSVFVRGVQYWTASAGAPLSTPGCNAGSGVCCQPGYPGCIYVQDLYVSNSEYRHVTSLSNVVSNTWYYAYDSGDGAIRNNVYLRNNPAGKTVELGAKNYAFSDSASNITIKNLTIEKYAPPLQFAAVEPQGPNWLIQNNEVRLNHAWGIKAMSGGDNAQIRNNNVHDNGEDGIGTGGSEGGVIDSNTIVHNNVNNVMQGFEGGGTKFSGDNLMVSNNIVHDNIGVGLHADAGATHITFNHNTVYNNQGCGIRYEVSRYGTIENNTAYGNGLSGIGACGAQITYTGSDHGRITGNKVIDGGTGGIRIYNTVGTKPFGQTVYKVTDTRVTGNTIVVSNKASDIASGLIDTAKPLQPSIFTDRTNVWANNIYQISGTPWTNKSWNWGENAAHAKPVNWSTWLLIHAAGELLRLN